MKTSMFSYLPIVLAECRTFLQIQWGTERGGERSKRKTWTECEKYMWRVIWKICVERSPEGSEKRNNAQQGTKRLLFSINIHLQLMHYGSYAVGITPPTIINCTLRLESLSWCIRLYCATHPYFRNITKHRIRGGVSAPPKWLSRGCNYQELPSRVQQSYHVERALWGRNSRRDGWVQHAFTRSSQEICAMQCEEQPHSCTTAFAVIRAKFQLKAFQALVKSQFENRGEGMQKVLVTLWKKDDMEQHGWPQQG